jgi:hypothetical protein
MATRSEACEGLRPSSAVYRTPSGPMMFHAQNVIVKPRSARRRRFLV